MGFSKGSGLVSVLVLVLVALVSVAVVSGQDLPSCVAKLLPCAQYLNSTTPSETCCSSIRDAIQNDFECLCNLFNNPDLFKSFNINITQALQLPKHCGIITDISLCEAPAPAPAPDAPDGPAGTPGGILNGAPGDAPSGTPRDTLSDTPGSTPGDNNGISGLTWIGMSGFIGFLFLWASIIM